MYIMPSTPLTCSSMGAATVSATTWALAPGYDADTSTVGGVMSGYWATGSVNNAMVPASTITMDSTEAKIGRLMKNFENTSKLLLVGPWWTPLFLFLPIGQVALTTHLFLVSSGHRLALVPGRGVLAFVDDRDGIGWYGIFVGWIHLLVARRFLFR